MLEASPSGASCAQHPEIPAGMTCNRCGNFMCTACESRVRPDATPMCPKCFALRRELVRPQDVSSGTKLQTAGLVLGCLSLIPAPPLIIVAFILNIVALVQARSPEARAVRWKPAVGLALSFVWPVILVGYFLIFGIHDASGSGK